MALNNLSPADISAQRNAALQQRATSQGAPQVRQAPAGNPDQVNLSGLTPDQTVAAAQDNALHTGLVKNDISGSGSGSDAPPSTATDAAPQTGPNNLVSPDFQDGSAGADLAGGHHHHDGPGPSDGPAPTDPTPPPPPAPPSDPNNPTPPSDPNNPTPPAPPAPPPDPRVQAAQAVANQKAEEDQVRAIFMQMQADARKAQADMWKIIQDTNQKIFEIIEGVAVNRAMSVQKSIDAWSQYLAM